MDNRRKMVSPLADDGCKFAGEKMTSDETLTGIPCRILAKPVEAMTQKIVFIRAGWRY
jgi:hypothetical protein